MSHARRAAIAAIALAEFTLLSACARRSAPGHAPVVSSIETTEIASPPASAYAFEEKKRRARKHPLGPISVTVTTPSTNPVVVARLTLNKASILKRTFLYGSDLQYSSLVEEEQFRQAEAISHTPAFFRIVDNRLQLLADLRHRYDSDVNHPERLLHEFKILSQTSKSLTIELSAGSPVLNTVAGDKEAKPARTSWLRSAKYVAEGDYVLFESSIEMADGSVAEFMESFFPRDAVVPSDVKVLLADPEIESLAERFRFHDDGDIYLEIPEEGRVKTKVAVRFGTQHEKPIEWYVTPNVPSEYLPQIKHGIEGWNRYSQKLWGRDIVVFKGLLPEGVKLGDPRYNVVSWDSITDADWAFESQAVDPFTGFTTHSLIYLPRTWAKKGIEYWELGGPSEKGRARLQKLKKSIARGRFLGRKLSVRCLDDVMEKITLSSRTDPETFGKILLRNTLFHEVGHALGIAHNFKASLSYDPDDSNSAFSTSVMDYNQFHLEQAAYDSLDSAQGPLLAYDHQMVALLYNGEKHENSPVLPACEDTEADDEDGGVDPLCNRYDAGRDPSLQFIRTIDLIRDSKSTSGATQSLSVSISELEAELEESEKILTKESAESALESFVKRVNGIVSFYYRNGGQSLANMAKVNVRALRAWKDSALTKTGKYDELEMRRRAIEGIRYTSTAESLEPETRTAIDRLRSDARVWLESTPYVRAISQGDRAAELNRLLKELDAIESEIEKKILSGMRVKLFTEMHASEKAPFYMIETPTHSFDFEREAAQILSRATTEALVNGQARELDERVAAAKALKSFAGTPLGGSFVAEAVKTLLSEAKAARDMGTRSRAVAVHRALTNSPDTEESDE